MAEVEDKLLDHEYDGIQEFDNPLPSWWVGLFVLTIIWGVVYLFYYDITGMGDTQLESYQEELAIAEEKYGGENAEESIAIALMDSEDDIAEGKKIYEMNCQSCHGAAGEGGVGPNLGDKFWKHGGDFESIANVIINGVAEKGMISWQPILKTKKIVQVTSYIDQKIRNTNPPNGKAPEGEEYQGE